MIGLIVAIDSNYLIGNRNKLPWNIPEDLKLFKQITSDNIVVMGRNTFDSIRKPLPNRINIVLTTKKIPKYDNLITVSDFNELHEKIRFFYKNSRKKIFIIGGYSLYIHFLPLVDELHISKIEGNFKGELFFRELSTFDYSPFKLISSKKFDGFTYYHYKK